MDATKIKPDTRPSTARRMLRMVASAGLIYFLLMSLFNWFLYSEFFDDVFVKTGQAMAKYLPDTPDDHGTKGYDYDSIAESWAAHPKTSDWADLTPPESDIHDEQHSAEAAVFYVYPSGYFGFRLNSPANPSLWRDPLGVVGDFLADATGGMVHASVFNSAAEVFTPRYRQMSGWAFMLPKDDPRREHAMNIALNDVEQAFEHFLKVNKGRPFMLASHSQGSMVLCRMIKKRYDSRDSRHIAEIDNLVVAYLVAADLSDGECGAFVRQCAHPNQLGCFVHYNVFMDNGDRSKFLLAPLEKNLSCVNPLSFRSDEKLVPHTMNPGSRPIFRPLQIAQAIFRFIASPLMTERKADYLNFMSPLEPALFGAQCRTGVVWINVQDFPSGFLTTGLFPGKNIHGGESSLYYLSTRLNAKQRVLEFTRTKGIKL